MKKAESKREEIVQQAYRIFYERGFHATGVDRMLEDSGISKRTVYKYFRSKEELISAAIVYYHHKTAAMVSEELEKRAKDPRGKILAIFDWRREVLESGDFTGCLAINAKLEYEGKNKEIEAACGAFVAELETLMLELCKAAGVRRPQTVARQLMILLEGTIVYGASRRDPEISAAARDVARKLLDG